MNSRVTPSSIGGRSSYGSTVLKKTPLASSSFKQQTTSNTAKIASLYDTGKLKNTSNNVIGKKAPKAKQEDKAWLKSILSKDPSIETDSLRNAETIWSQIQAVTFPSRRLSVSDNELVHTLVKLTHNDPSVTEVIMTDDDPRVQYLEPALLLEVAESMCWNTHVQKLVLKGMKLGNEFSSALATSLQVNCMLEYLDVSDNGFTNAKEFLKTVLHVNRPTPLSYIDISNQHDPIRKYDKIVKLLENKNCNLRTLKADFSSSEAETWISSILKSKIDLAVGVNYGLLLVGALEAELARRNGLNSRGQSEAIEIPKFVVEKEEAKYFIELEERSKRFKLRLEDETVSTPQNTFLQQKASNISLAQISASLFTGDGAFLNDEFISKHLVSAPDKSLTFEFNNQSKLFRRFTKTDPARDTIVRRFVDVLVKHPKAPDITHLNMANTLLSDDWLEYFCEKCSADSTLLHNLHSLNIESNSVSDSGIQALAAALEKTAWKYLQAIKLDNQKKPLATETETKLLYALAKNRTVIKLSLRVRNSCQRDQINLIMTRNIDLLRQARMDAKPTSGKRMRNKMESMFDSIAANDDKIASVTIVADKVFQSLHPKEKIKAAQSFRSNSHVIKVQLNGLQLDDAFAVELGESLKKNTTIESLDLESNSLGSDGIVALLRSLQTNRTIQTLKVRHQKKPLSSADEEKVATFIEDNNVITSLGVEPMRNPLAKMKVERKIRDNQDLKRRSKARR